jgi:pimeloyl-ACP methyl ester carboxylesterase
MASNKDATTTVTAHEAEQVERANASKRVPVVFVHGLWLLPSSWDRWAELFEKNGYTTLSPHWPDDPETVAEAKAHPEVFANKSVGQVADHFEDVRAVPLTYEQFRYAFANAVSEDEAKELYETFAVPTSGEPLFQAAAANLNPWTEAKVNTKNPERGPLLIMDGEKDHTVPWAIANASYKKQARNKGVTEIVKVPSRGHSLTIDNGWREVADIALAFVQKHGPTP